MWYLLHDQQTYDKLQLQLPPHSEDKPDLAKNDFYSALKVAHRKFKKEKDILISELNQKYIHPHQIKGFLIGAPKKP